MGLCSLPHPDIVFNDIIYGKHLAQDQAQSWYPVNLSHYHSILALECPNFFIEAQIFEVQPFIL